MAEIQLPEITIEGSADARPVNASDWFSEGFMVGFNAPDPTPDRPLMINDDLAGSFFQGVAVGQSTAADLTAEFERSIADQPEVVPDLGGETLEKVQERFREEFERLFGKEMPHTETEGEVFEPVLPPNITLVE